MRFELTLLFVFSGAAGLLFLVSATTKAVENASLVDERNQLELRRAATAEELREAKETLEEVKAVRWMEWGVHAHTCIGREEGGI